MIDVNNRICVICGSDKYKLLFPQRFNRISGGSLLDGYDVVACCECGFCFARNLPDQAEFDKYYRELSKYDTQQLDPQLTEFSNKRYQRTVDLLTKYIDDKKIRVLDVGCSTGGLLNTLKQNGYYNLLGLDPSPQCVKLVKNLYDIEAIEGSLTNLASQPRYDLIILGAVLEHICDIKTVMIKLREILSPKGYLYIDAPDATKFENIIEAPFQEFSVEHINYFSTISLNNLMGMFGFRKISIIQNVSELSKGNTANEIIGIFQKTDELPSFKIKFDDLSAISLEKYICNSNDIEIRVHKIVDQIVYKNEPIMVWGVGTHTQRLLATSKLKDANIQAYIDSNPNYHGKLLNNIQIISPEESKKYPYPIIISTRISQKNIENMIKDTLKLPNKLIFFYD